jgi:DNA-binding response OmpR family regulator
VNARPVIVCAEDDDDVLALVALRLGRAGYEVVTVRDGEAALAAVRERRPSLLVLDVMMPRLGGLEVIEKMRGDHELRNVKVILLSARAQDADVARGVEAGADAYLVKPFKFGDLEDTVAQLLT